MSSPTPRQTCGCPRFQNCACEFELAASELGGAFDRAIARAAHENHCARLECGRCSCETKRIFDELAATVKHVVDAGRKGFS